MMKTQVVRQSSVYFVCVASHVIHKYLHINGLYANDAFFAVIKPSFGTLFNNSYGNINVVCVCVFFYPVYRVKPQAGKKSLHMLMAKGCYGMASENESEWLGNATLKSFWSLINEENKSSVGVRFICVWFTVVA